MTLYIRDHNNQTIIATELWETSEGEIKEITSITTLPDQKMKEYLIKILDLPKGNYEETLRLYEIFYIEIAKKYNLNYVVD